MAIPIYTIAATFDSPIASDQVQTTSVLNSRRLIQVCQLLSIAIAAVLLSGYSSEWNIGLKVLCSPTRAVYFDGGVGDGRVLGHLQMRATPGAVGRWVQARGRWQFRMPDWRRSLWEFDAHRMRSPIVVPGRPVSSWIVACPIWCLLAPCLILPAITWRRRDRGDARGFEIENRCDAVSLGRARKREEAKEREEDKIASARRAVHR